MAPIGTAGREGRFAERAEAVAIAGKASLRSLNVGYGVTAEPEGVVRAGLPDCVGHSRAEMSGHRGGQQCEGNYRHETDRETDRTCLDIVHHAQSLCHAHSVTASVGERAKREKAIIA
jgi:hypothetical protein